jgi:hypothetical protein
MPPSAPLANRSDSRIGNAILSGKVYGPALRPPNSGDVPLPKPRATTALTPSLPPLGVSVSVVFGVGSQEQMRRVSALGVVAAVQDRQARGNETVGLLICNAMGADGAGLQAKSPIPLVFET